MKIIKRGGMEGRRNGTRMWSGDCCRDCAFPPNLCTLTRGCQRVGEAMYRRAGKAGARRSPALLWYYSLYRIVLYIV